MAKPVRIQLSRRKGWRMPENTVSVARPGKFGNPFTKEAAIESGYATEGNWQWFVVDCFADWLRDNGDWWQGPESDARLAAIRANLAELRGKNLACWCKLCDAHRDGKPIGETCPDCAPCHADVLLELTNSDALAKAEHLIALGDATVYLHDESDFPFDKVVRVEEGNSWRLGGPSSCRLIAEEAGLTFSLSVDFERRDASGRGVSLFDRDRLRELMLKLPSEARRSFADMLADKVLPAMVGRTNEVRAALRSQSDSEDCVRGLIAFAAEQADAA